MTFVFLPMRIILLLKDFVFTFSIGCQFFGRVGGGCLSEPMKKQIPYICCENNSAFDNTVGLENSVNYDTKEDTTAEFNIQRLFGNVERVNTF